MITLILDLLDGDASLTPTPRGLYEGVWAAGCSSAKLSTAKHYQPGLGLGVKISVQLG